jgi:pullulanase
MSYVRGGKVWVESDQIGWIALEEDWRGDQVPEDLVSESGLVGFDFSQADLMDRAAMGGYVQVEEGWLFYLSSETLAFHDLQQDGIYLLGDFNDWKPSKDYLLSETQGGVGVLIKPQILAEIETCEFKFCTDEGRWIEPHAEFPSTSHNSSLRNHSFSQKRTGLDLFRFRLVSPNNGCDLEKWIQTRPTGQFGFSSKDGHSSFRLFAPRAVGVDLILANQSNLKEDYLPMHLSEDGCWTIAFPQDLTGKHYKFRVHQIDGLGQKFAKEIVDPYAKATSGRGGYGIAISQKPRQTQMRFTPPPMEDVVVVEAHVRDLMKHAPLDLEENDRLGFRGLSEWLKSKNSYLNQLGANVVELQPVQEFDAKTKNEYHWGYMPINFFSPASVYGRDHGDGSVIEEFSDLVKSIHNEGMAVVIDVVYNHVGIPPHLMHLDREIYFLAEESGKLTNFSGCGNDLNCNSQPARKLILDSLIYWVEAFDVDGFRFDLGELLGYEFLAEIEDELKKIKPGVLLFAEPWSFRGRLPEQMNQTGYALWSDACREELLLFAKSHAGNDAVLELLRNGLDQNNRFACQSVNYLESHDDFALVDRFRDLFPFDEEDTMAPELVSRVMLALGLLLVAPGVPMLSAGQDFLRHKRGIRNTYLDGEVNALNYPMEQIFHEEVAFVRRMIRLRLSNHGRRSRRPHEEQWQLYSFLESHRSGVAFGWANQELRQRYLITANSSCSELHLDLPEPWNQSGEVLASYGSSGLNQTRIEPLSFCWFSYEGF